MTHFGATPDEWAHFDLLLGLTEDLLPVVSNPNATISPDSKMKGLGKTPSRYNRNRQVSGIKDWTEHKATGDEVARWSGQADYGICIQTRRVRALDIDVPDIEKADAIAVRAAELLPEIADRIPLRFRRNSGKRLLAFVVEGELAKRTLQVDGGIVEFLANGQQFVAVGEHFGKAGPSGSRYEWAGGLPEDFPSIGIHNFERMWRVLCDEFGIAPPSEGVLRRRGEAFDATDGVAEYLIEQDLVLDQGREGQLFIDCPWADDHSMDSGPSQTAWFPAGTGGYAQGHFKCLHAHCGSRSDAEFLDHIGYRLADFDVVAEAPADGGALVEVVDAPWPVMKRDSQGRIEAVLTNVVAALGHPAMCGVHVAFDKAIHDIVIREALSQPWRSLTDVDCVRLRVRLEGRGFKPIGRELIRDAILDVADAQGFDSFDDWISGLKWDGVPRVETFLPRYFGATAATNTGAAYLAAVGRYWWSAAAGRIVRPGVQADMVPVLVGDQGLGKTQGLKALLPNLIEEAPAYVEIDLAHRDDDLARKLRGGMLGEIAELRGLRSRDADAIKAWITRQEENWTPKYMERNTRFKRRLIFVGTTNDGEFLDDPTGERRWLPVQVEGGVDIAGLLADRDQLWAEGLVIYRAGGVAWREAQELAKLEHDGFRVRDPWEADIGAWLDEPDTLTGDAPRARSFLQIGDVLASALRIEPRSVSKREEMRVGRALKALGYERTLMRVSGRPQRVWLAKCNHEQPPRTTSDFEGGDAEGADLA